MKNKKNIYQGIKFNVEINRKEINHYHLKELNSYCKIFHKNSLAPSYSGGSYGNLSFRKKKFKNEFIITPSNSCLGNLENKDFVEITNFNLEKKKIFCDGLRKPSSETILHYFIYKKRPEINAIFHGHSKKILDFSEKKNIISTKNEIPYGTIELVDATLKILEDNYFFILKNHGFFSIGKSMKESWRITKEIMNQIKY